MLYYDNLEEIIFNKHEFFDIDELIIISGYIGPSPIRRLEELPFKSTVIYGMYGCDSISLKLHNTLLDIQNLSKKVSIKYCKTPIHSKCYIWRNSKKIVCSLIGSANFSINGLTTPNRESLADVTRDSFDPLNKYLDSILSNSIDCNSHDIIFKSTPNKEINKKSNKNIMDINTHNSYICSMTLLDPRTNEVQKYSGLNWQNSKANVSEDDALIPIRTQYIRDYPLIFPPKQTVKTKFGEGKSQRQNDTVEFIWDDGTIMKGLLEGTQTIDGIQYPKNLCSSVTKNELGKYMKDRLGLPYGSTIQKSDLDNYGRTTIDISLLQEGVYYLDFSVSN